MLGLMTTEDSILLTGEFTTPLFVRFDNFEFARWSNCDRTMREPHQPDDGRAGGSPKHEFTTTGHVRSTVLWSLSHTLARRRDCPAAQKRDELAPSHRGLPEVRYSRPKGYHIPTPIIPRSVIRSRS